MITRNYIDRFNTIIHGSEINVGISPVAILEYGNDDRMSLLMYFGQALDGMRKANLFGFAYMFFQQMSRAAR